MKETQSHTLWDNSRGKRNETVIIKSKFVITTPNWVRARERARKEGSRK
jgi:hypothetical protein